MSVQRLSDPSSRREFRLSELCAALQANDPELRALSLSPSKPDQCYYYQNYPWNVKSCAHGGYHPKVGRALHGNCIVSSLIVSARCFFTGSSSSAAATNDIVWSEFEPLRIFLQGIGRTNSLQTLAIYMDDEASQDRNLAVSYATLINTVLATLRASCVDSLPELRLDTSTMCLGDPELPKFLSATSKLRRLSITLGRFDPPDSCMDAFAQNTSLDHLTIKCDLKHFDPSPIMWKLNVHPKLRSLALDFVYPAQGYHSSKLNTTRDLYGPLFRALSANTSLESLFLRDDCLHPWSHAIAGLDNHPSLREFKIQVNTCSGGYSTDSATLIQVLGTEKVTHLVAKYPHGGLSDEAWQSIVTAFVQGPSISVLALCQSGFSTTLTDVAWLSKYKRHMEVKDNGMFLVLYPLLFASPIPPILELTCRATVSYTGHHWHLTEAEMHGFLECKADALNAMIHLRKLTISSGLHKRDTIRAFVKQNGNLEQVVFDHGDMTYDITAYTGRNRDIHQLLDAFTLDAEASPSTSAPSAWQAGMVPTLFRATMQTPHAAGNNILMTLLTKSQACLFPRVSRKRKC